METWLAEGHWQWLRAGGVGSQGDLCRICALGPLEEQAELGYGTVGVPSASLPSGYLEDVLPAKCSCAAVKPASGLRPPVPAEPGTPHITVLSLLLCNWSCLSP